MGRRRDFDVADVRIRKGGLEMVQLRLSDSAATSELEAFLRRCECFVNQVGPRLLAVGIAHDIDTAAAVRQLRIGRCVRCEEPIEEAVFRLGSPLCLDCRAEPRRDEDAIVRDAWTRMEVEAYVQVWRALHPDSAVELVA
jgi:hypothetical protein